MIFKSRLTYFGFGYGFGGCSVMALLIFWFAPLSKLHFAVGPTTNGISEMEMEDSSLIDRIKNQLIPPRTATPDVSYNFQNCTNNNVKALASIEHNPSCGQVQKVEDILRSLTPGFYVECGANDGCHSSNSLWLERKLGWSGLLVEADPNAWKKLMSVRRKAWHLNTCLSTQPRPQNTTFYLNPNAAAVSGLKKSGLFNAVEPFTMQCLPLYSILLALNRTTVDFFSLDVEGSEMDILQTIPFHKITFKVLSIEHLLIPNGKEVIRRFMESKGYIFYGTVVKIYTESASCAGDSIYIHPSLSLTEEQRSQIGQDDPKPVVHVHRQ